MPVGGALKLKGGDALHEVKKKKKKKRQRSETTDETSSEAADETKVDGSPSAEAAPSGQLKVEVRPEEEEEEPVLRPVRGVGYIASSGTVLSGYGTAFTKELRHGDQIIITHPTTLMEESRMVRMLLSDMSCAIDAPFSSDLLSSTSFRYIRMPKQEEETEETRAAKKRRNDAEEEGSALGTYAGNLGTTVTKRVKKAGAYGGYKIITESSDRELTRSEMLEVRSKAKGDRHCY
uniref:Uncharacterized protein n=1 Tax=Phaeomonas parva TaxID=124430 RepID=A0A7S1XT62_9STRA|mmetsp:Transcript_31021/g.98512  ORF Transcript_31021/g.98512 Transcript_31021/m.98512 type:complete len:234 (+) Transcript_31021:200-901(+)